MADETRERPVVDTDGGAYIGDDVSVQGGDFVGRDKIVNYYQLDIERLMEALRAALPADDPTPQHLLDTLEQFRTFHEQLYEWKELHNYLNDILYVVGQFVREVERLDAQGLPGDARALARLWRPVTQKVGLLLEWARGIKHISAPLSETPEGLRGPRWAVELAASRRRVDEVLKPTEFNLHALYDAAYDFVDSAERHMYLADKALRETAGELYTLSRMVLGELKP